MVALAWAGGLAAVAGVAFVGTREPAPTPTVAEARLPSASTPAPVDPVEPVLQVLAPNGPGALITTPRLIVRGTRAADVALRVTVESRGGKLLASEWLAPTTRTAFHVEFPLSNPRPGGTMVVQVVGLTADGIPVDVVRRPVEIGPLVPVRTGPFGDDGIVGGIVFGTAWDPDALGSPDTPPAPGP